jgi:hypothetical protein
MFTFSPELIQISLESIPDIMDKTAMLFCRKLKKLRKYLS